jgi:DNA-binding NtrC family response regulator
MGVGDVKIKEHGATTAVATRPAPVSIPAHLKTTVRVLVVHQERQFREGLTATLRSEGYALSAVSSAAEGIEALERNRFDIVLTDLFPPPVTGLDVLRAARKRKPDTIVIVITGNPSLTSSVEALRAGAWDYLPRPFSATHLNILVCRAAYTVLQTREVRELRAALLQQGGRGELLPLLGAAPAFREALSLARKVAPTDASVFITGESGTGKELFAQFIHSHSRRSTKPLVAINCAALPEPLLESEMFGHRKGAFTGADRDKAGLLETADGGTMFLDEVTEMPAALQPKLLRVLQDGVVRRVGSEQTDATVDIRFISATNRDIPQAVSSGTLRSDFMYRLRVVSVRIPPLRERREDIPLLAAHFLSHFWERHRRPGTLMPKLAKETLDFLREQSWCGNVRELQNVMEQVVVFVEPGHEILPADIPIAEGSEACARIRDTLDSDFLGENYHTAKEKLVAEFERVYFRGLVRRSGGNLARAARLASIDRTTLYRLLEKHNLQVRRETHLESED